MFEVNTELLLHILNLSWLAVRITMLKPFVLVLEGQIRANGTFRNCWSNFFFTTLIILMTVYQVLVHTERLRLRLDQ